MTAKGVDSDMTADFARGAAIELASFIGGAVAVSGEVDLVTDGSLVARSYGGSPIMKSITGSGCALGGVCAVHLAVAEPFIAALAATALFNLAGSRAASKADGPGSFQWRFLDELAGAAPEDVAGNRLELEAAR